jgi:cation diffusion facilitator family transporter
MAASTRRSEIERVLVITLIANLLVAGAKITIGLISGSLAMIADGVHSSLDGTSNIIGLVSNRLAARPPDAEHPYGHRRFETLASMMIGGILLLTGWELIKNSISHLSTHTMPEIGFANFAAMIGTIVVNVVVTTYESRAGRRFNSEFLLADAAHTRSDILVSFTVLASLVAARLGLGWVDAAAAIVVVGLIAMVAWRIVSASAGILVDRAALNGEDVMQVVEPVAGVQRVIRVRSRGPGDEVHLDLDVEIAGPTTAEHSSAIATEVRKQLRQHFDGLTDIQVNFVPSHSQQPDLILLIRAEADALGLGVHEIIPTRERDQLSLEMHVEVPADQSVGEAHAHVTEFEQRLKESIPGLSGIVTHIEPAPAPTDVPRKDGSAHALARKALNLAEAIYPQGFWHDALIRVEPDGGYALSMHCYVSPDMPLEEAHHIAENVETQIRAALPGIHRLTIHTEPPDAA